MRSAHVKVLHRLLGRPLVSYPVHLARELGAEPIVAVLGHQREAVEASLVAAFGDGTIRTVEQAEQRGTGHAVRLAMPALRRFAGIVIILYGDVPLLRRETVRALVGTARRYGCLALVTTSPPDPDRLRPHPARPARPHHRCRRAEGRVGRRAGHRRDQRRHLRRAGRLPAHGDRGPERAQRPGRVLPDRHRGARRRAASASARSTLTFATSPASTIAGSWPNRRRSCARVSTAVGCAT